jgi:hypothetical protein
MAHIDVRVVEQVPVQDELITELWTTWVTGEDLLGYHSSKVDHLPAVIGLCCSTR